MQQLQLLRKSPPGGGRRKTSYFWVAKLKEYDTFNAGGKVRNFNPARTGTIKGRDRDQDRSAQFRYFRISLHSI